MAAIVSAKDRAMQCGHLSIRPVNADMYSHSRSAHQHKQVFDLASRSDYFAVADVFCKNFRRYPITLRLKPRRRENNVNKREGIN
jgi:hypothetical protein